MSAFCAGAAAPCSKALTSTKMLFMKSNLLRFIIVLLMTTTLLAWPQILHASGLEQYQHRVTIGGRVPGAVLIVGWQKDEKDVKRLVDLVAQHADEAYRTINGDISRLNGSSAGTTQTVGWQTAELLSRGVQVSKWTKTDILKAPGGNGGYKDISVKEKSRSVEIKKDGIRLQAQSIINGYIADLMIRYISASNMQNAMVKVGNVFRGMGQSTRGPWKIQVQEDSSTYARHALNITVSNSGAATISSTQMTASRCKGATIIMNEAALAEGVAYAIMIKGPNEGMKILSKLGSARGLIVDKSGKFVRYGL